MIRKRWGRVQINVREGQRMGKPEAGIYWSHTTDDVHGVKARRARRRASDAFYIQFSSLAVSALRQAYIYGQR